MSYSIDFDVTRKIAHVTLASGINPIDFREEAYTEINMGLRKIYVIPISTSDETDLAFLKSIESDIAAGNLILDIASTSQDEAELDEYGKHLLEKGRDKLKKLVDGTLILTGATKDTDNPDNFSEDAPFIGGQAPDEYATFARPMSGVESDAINAVVDSKAYNAMTDNDQL